MLSLQVRFWPHTIIDILDLIKHDLQRKTRRSNGLLPIQQLFCALCFYANGKQKQMSCTYHVSCLCLYCSLSLYSSVPSYIIEQLKLTHLRETVCLILCKILQLGSCLCHIEWKIVYKSIQCAQGTRRGRAAALCPTC